MGRPRQSAGYPTIYGQLIQAVSASGKEFKHKCGTKQEASTLRFSLYDYIKTLKTSSTLFERDLGEQAAGLMFCVKDNFLIIKPRDTQAQALALSDSLMEFEQSEAVDQRVPVSPNTIAHTYKVDPAHKSAPSHDDVISQYLKGDKK